MIEVDLPVRYFLRRPPLTKRQNHCKNKKTKAVRINDIVTMDVYHLPKDFGNFGWNVNGKAILVFPTGKFPEFSGRPER